LFDGGRSPAFGTADTARPFFVNLRDVSMLKKLVILGVIGFVAVTAIKGSKFGSYLRAEWNSLRERCEANIPPEREIERLRNEVQMLESDMRNIVKHLARENVEVAQLREQVADLNERQGRDKELLTSRGKAIKDAIANSTASPTEFVSFGDRKLSIDDAKAELDEGVRRYALNQRAFEAQTATLASREKVRDTLAKQLDTMRNQKNELAAAIDALEAEVTALKLHQMESKYQTDDSRLAKIKEDIRALQKKLKIQREEINLLPAALDAPPAKSSTNKSVDDILAPLTGSNADSKVIE
jgi:chromosome segregation ATPase